MNREVFILEFYPWKATPEASVGSSRTVSIAARARVLLNSMGVNIPELGRFQQAEKLVLDIYNHKMELNPNDVQIQLEMGDVLLYSGQTDEAIKFFETGFQIDPNWGPGCSSGQPNERHWAQVVS